MGKRLMVIAICFVFGFFLFPFEPAFAGPDGDAKKAYDMGNFDNAVKILIEKLRKKNDHQDNINLLETSLALAMKKHISAAQDGEANGNWDIAYNEYLLAKKLGDAVALLPPVQREVQQNGKKVKQPFTFTAENVSEVMAKARTNAIITHYDKGKEYQAAGKFKEAAIEFRGVKKYDPSYQDAASRYDDCRKKATLRIAVMPFENISGKTQFGELGQIAADQIISKALGYAPEFIEFITRDYLGQLLAEQGIQQSSIADQSTATQLGKTGGVHAFIFGKVNSVLINYPPDETKYGNGCDEIYVDKSKITVCARWCMHTRAGQVKVGASYQIVNVEKGNIMSAESINEDVEDRAQWVTLTPESDQRAVPNEVRKHQIGQGERSIDPPELLVNKAMESLCQNLAGTLVNYFK